MPGSTRLAAIGPREPTGDRAGDRAPGRDEKHFGRRQQRQAQREKEARCLEGLLHQKATTSLGRRRLRDPCVCREAKHLWQWPKARANDRHMLQARGFGIWRLRKRWDRQACCGGRGRLRGVGGMR